MRRRGKRPVGQIHSVVFGVEDMFVWEAVFQVRSWCIVVCVFHFIVVVSQPLLYTLLESI